MFFTVSSSMLIPLSIALVHISTLLLNLLSFIMLCKSSESFVFVSFVIISHLCIPSNLSFMSFASDFFVTNTSHLSSLLSFLIKVVTSLILLKYLQST